MKSELNDYKIANIDGIIQSKNDVQKRFDNDNPNYIKENPLSNQSETFIESETYDWDKKSEKKQTNSSNNSSHLMNSTSATSSTSAISGSLGSIVGGVVSSVVASVVIVAVFISMMTINISLIFAGTNSLVFQLEISGAQQEDFNSQIYAVLQGDGVYYSQEIFEDSIYLSFDNLESGKEYTITIRNEEKIFVEKSYFTATNRNEKVFMEAWNEENTISAWIYFEDIALDEYYTLTAKDNLGNVLFSESDVELEREFYFEVENVELVMLTLSVNGKVCCVQEIYMPVEYEYDYKDGTWSWNEDYSVATISFPEIYGREPLDFVADIEEILDEPTCEEDGSITYIASVVIDDEEYCDEKVEIIKALGHDYCEPIFDWQKTNDGGYIVTATFICANDRSHTEIIEADMEMIEVEMGISYVATVEFDGETYQDNYIEEKSGVEISLNNGALYIRPNDYVQSNKNGTYTTNISSALNPYIITGSIRSAESIDIYNFEGSSSDTEGRGNGEKETFYIVLDNVSITASSWCTAFRIIAREDVDIYITVVGSVSISAYNHAAFSLQAEAGCHANIYVTCDGGFDNFTCLDSYNNINEVFEASGQTSIDFYMNGVLVDVYGNEIQ